VRPLLAALQPSPKKPKTPAKEPSAPVAAASTDPNTSSLLEDKDDSTIELTKKIKPKATTAPIQLVPMPPASWETACGDIVNATISAERNQAVLAALATCLSNERATVAYTGALEGTLLDNPGAPKNDIIKFSDTGDYGCYQPIIDVCDYTTGSVSKLFSTNVEVPVEAETFLQVLNDDDTSDQPSLLVGGRIIVTPTDATFLTARSVLADLVLNGQQQAADAIILDAAYLPRGQSNRDKMMKWLTHDILPSLSEFGQIHVILAPQSGGAMHMSMCNTDVGPVSVDVHIISPFASMRYTRLSCIACPTARTCTPCDTDVCPVSGVSNQRQQ
jgi:hypothetical protein